MYGCLKYVVGRVRLGFSSCFSIISDSGVLSALSCKVGFKNSYKPTLQTS